jgi:hypothetical protein
MAHTSQHNTGFNTGFPWNNQGSLNDAMNGVEKNVNNGLNFQFPKANIQPSNSPWNPPTSQPGNGYSPSGGQGGQNKFGFNPSTVGVGLSALDTLGGLWSAYNSNKFGKQQIALGRDELDFSKQVHKDNFGLQLDTANLNIEQVNQQKAMQRDVIEKTRLHKDAGAYAGYQDIAPLKLNNNSQYNRTA